MNQLHTSLSLSRCGWYVNHRHGKALGLLRKQPAHQRSTWMIWVKVGRELRSVSCITRVGFDCRNRACSSNMAWIDPQHSEIKDWRSDVAPQDTADRSGSFSANMIAAPVDGALLAQASSSAPSGLICPGTVAVGKEFANRKGGYGGLYARSRGVVYLVG